MYNVYYKNNPIIISEQINNLTLNNHNFICRYQDIASLSLAFELFNFKLPNLDFINPLENIELFWKKFKSNFIYIEAAGGLIKNNKDEYLFIYKKNKWDLPKGKAEKGESPQQTAFREIHEETGLDKIQIIAPLQSTFHIFEKKNHIYLKKTFWYKFQASDYQTLIPQTEEGITAIEWLSKTQIKNEVIKNTYNSVITIINEGISFNK